MDSTNEFFFNESALATTIDRYALLPEHEVYNQNEIDFSDFNMYFILSGEKYSF